MKDFQVGDRVRIVNVFEAESLEHFTGQEGVVSYIYPSKNAPFPIYVDFEGGVSRVPFGLNEVVAV